MFALTVSQLNRYVKAVLEEDPKLSDLYIKGEISNLTRHRQSGHLYFSLKDASSAVKAVMFRSSAQDLRFEPESGMAVLARASVGLFERDGAYQLYVTDLQPDGAGALAVAFEQRKAKLAALGYFDEQHKRPLPRYPGRIGVVTSESGAALQDIVNVLSRRYPLATLVLAPAQVQGERSAPSLVRGVRALDGRCDVIILGRGGGAAEDLWSFNDEALAKAVFLSQTPIISAVGHETDYTICDFVADVRAPTPSAAAELAAPSLEGLRRRLFDRREYLLRHAGQQLSRRRERLAAAAALPALRSPLAAVEKSREKLDFLYDMMYNNKNILWSRLHRELGHRAAMLDSLSPLRVLERGYAAVLDRSGRAVTVSRLHAGERVTLRFADGEAQAVIREVALRATAEKGGAGSEEESDL